MRFVTLILAFASLASLGFAAPAPEAATQASTPDAVAVDKRDHHGGRHGGDHYNHRHDGHRFHGDHYRHQDGFSGHYKRDHRHDGYDHGRYYDGHRHHDGYHGRHGYHHGYDY